MEKQKQNMETKLFIMKMPEIMNQFKLNSDNVLILQAFCMNSLIKYCSGALRRSPYKNASPVQSKKDKINECMTFLTKFRYY